MDRRLAAILAADVVGYSRLMEADEAGTLAALGLAVTDVENVVVLNDVDDLAGEAWFEDASAWGLI